MSTQTQSIVITVSQTGAQQTAQAVGSIAPAAKGSDDALKQLQNTLKGLGGLLAIDQLKEWADVWTRATGLVNIFSKSQAETNLVLQKLYDISQNTRQALDATVKSYHQMAIAGQQLGASQNDILKVTQLVGEAFAIQGTPAQTAKAGIIQLGHAFTEGIVRGRQFNSLLIEMPRVLQVAADNIDTAGGSVGKLRQMMLAGQLTSKMLFDALVKGSDELTPLFEKTGKTFAQAFTVIENSTIKYVGQMTQASGVSTAFYDIVKLIADNIDVVAKSLLALASPFILQGLLGVVDALKAMALWAAANPFTAIIGALTIATTAALLFKDQIIVNQDEMLTLGDYISAVGGIITDVFGHVGPQQVNIFQASINGLASAWRDLMFAMNKPMSVDVTADAKERQNQFNQLATIKQEIEDKINSINSNAVTKWFGQSQLGPLQDQLNKTIGLMAKAQDDEKALLTGQTPGSAAKGASSSTDDGGFLSDLTKRAKARRDQRAKDAADDLKQQQDAQKALAVPLGEAQDFEGGKKAKTYKNPLDNPNTLATAYRNLLNQIQPLSGAVLEYQRAQDILDREEANGTITAERKAELLELVKNHYRDIVDPLGAYLRNLERENSLLSLNSEDRQVQQKLYQETEDLRKKGLIIGQDEIDQLQQQIQANQDLARVTQVRDGIYSQMINQSRQYADELKAIGQLQADPKTNKQQLTDTVVTKGPNSDLFAGTKEAIDAAKNQYTDLYNYIDGLEQQNVISQQTASIARIRVFQQEQTTTLQGYANFFGTLATMRTADGSKGSKIAKAAAIAQASINAYTAATGAYASASAIPFIGWVLGPIAAAAALAAGLANVQQIRSQSNGFQSGGYTGDMGANSVAGDVHGREYVMDQMTTSRIGVHNLDDLRSGAATISHGQQQQVSPTVNVTPPVVNVAVVSSHDAAMAALRSEEGQTFIVETMAQNSGTLTRLAGG